MKLTKYEMELCKHYRKKDGYGRTRCKDCPLVISIRYHLCKKNVTDSRELDGYWGASDGGRK